MATADAFRFEVPECVNVLVTAKGLDTLDKLILYRMACEPECNEDPAPGDFVEFNPKGCQTFINTMNNPLLIDVPGTYELRFEGAFNPDVSICKTTYSRQCNGC